MLFNAPQFNQVSNRGLLPLYSFHCLIQTQNNFIKSIDLNELSWFFNTILNYLIFSSFIHYFAFYAVHCEYLRNINIKNLSVYGDHLSREFYGLSPFPPYNTSEKINRLKS